MVDYHLLGHMFRRVDTTHRIHRIDLGRQPASEAEAKPAVIGVPPFVPQALDFVGDNIFVLGNTSKAAVQLKFVVPLKMVPRQRVENKAVFGLTIEDLRSKDSGTVLGIAKKRKLQLTKTHIKRSGQLLVYAMLRRRRAKTKLLAEFVTMNFAILSSSSLVWTIRKRKC